MAESRIDDSPISPAEKQFVLDLIANARLNGILEIEYKALRIRLSPSAASSAHREIYTTQANQPMGWSTKLPKAGGNAL